MDNGSVRHRISICTRCIVARDRPGAQLQRLLHASVERHLVQNFVVDGIGCMAGCERPITVGFSAAGKASYLFGDVDVDRDAGHLLAFAQLYASLTDGWCSERHRPAGLAGKIIARIPAPEWGAS